MGRKKKRTRLTADKASATTITIRPHQYQASNGKWYHTHMVQGWKEDGKWQRKQFKDRAEAERFAAIKRVEVENQGRSQRMVLTSLDDSQLREAESALELLGETYSLEEAAKFFLANHRPPEFTISLSEGRKIYLDEQERNGTRERTLKQKKSVISMFEDYVEDIVFHKCTSAHVEGFLRSLKARDGISAATRKTWNNYRNDLNHLFSWAAEEDLATHRPWLFHNPVEKIRIYAAKQIAEQRAEKRVEIATTTPDNLRRMLTALMRWRDGQLVKYFALAYFAGIRPDGEMSKLAQREDELIDLQKGRILIPANVSKTKEERYIAISENLRRWLEFTEGKPVIPENYDRLVKRARAKFKLGHDETRHSFISFHVALHRSVGEAALQAGNSESIVKKHYLSQKYTSDDGAKYFSIVPTATHKRAKFDTKATSNNKRLKAV